MLFRNTFACALLALGLSSLVKTSAFAADVPAASEATVRAAVVEALTKQESAAQVEAVRKIPADAGPIAAELLTLWKEGGIYLHEDDEGKITPVTLTGPKDDEGKQAALLVLDQSPFKDAEGKPILIDPAEVSSAETDSNIRRAMKDLTDMAALSNPDIKVRLRAVSDVGLELNIEKLPALQARQKVETNEKVKKALEESIALTQLKSPDDAERIKACAALGTMGSIPSQDALKTLAAEATKEGKKEVAAAATAALSDIAAHVKVVNTAGTMFRGLSTGSILLVVAIGLAITFGLMGVINMAHGELLVVGAYTTYVVQCIFGAGLTLSPFSQSYLTFTIPGMHATGTTFSVYFLVALPCSFLMAALVGIALERGIIRFLYKRPLESLLATWGVSIVMQQLLRLVFGPQNVALESPSWLSGSWVVNDIAFNWNRLFVIGFAVMIIVLTWAVLNKTPLGLLIRSVMQNREMAACMGVRTERVNMLTFGFGSGLAGLAGAFISQIDNVGPYTGQNYIVDSFMTVVVGGVGNMIGTVISALGIGVVDQSLQQILGNPVLGKILVLGTIILFLQWRPQGIFVTRSRSLES